MYTRESNESILSNTNLETSTNNDSESTPVWELCGCITCFEVGKGSAVFKKEDISKCINNTQQKVKLNTSIEYKRQNDK